MGVEVAMPQSSDSYAPSPLRGGGDIRSTGRRECFS